MEVKSQYLYGWLEYNIPLNSIEFIYSLRYINLERAGILNPSDNKKIKYIFGAFTHKDKVCLNRYC